jgi:hypothetical protein
VAYPLIDSILHEVVGTIQHNHVPLPQPLRVPSPPFRPLYQFEVPSHLEEDAEQNIQHM